MACGLGTATAELSLMHTVQHCAYRTMPREAVLPNPSMHAHIYCKHNNNLQHWLLLIVAQPKS